MFISLSIYFFFSCFAGHRDLHSFPTRRSSDLGSPWAHLNGPQLETFTWSAILRAAMVAGYPTLRSLRSEEHTSELQSHSDLVCRLLLEKKKNMRKVLDRAEVKTAKLKQINSKG